MLTGPPLDALKFPTVIEALKAAHRGGLTFLSVDESESHFEWPEIYARACRAAAGLKALGVSEGERVAIVLPSCIEFMDTFFGCLLVGAVPVPLYPPVRLGRLDEYDAATAIMLQSVNATLLVSDSRIQRLLGRVVERARPRLGCVLATKLLEAANFERPVSSNELALIQFSSGSTRAPKAVALSHAGLMAQCAVLYKLMQVPVDASHCGVSWLPLYHDMGLIGALLLAVYYPGRLVLISPEHFLAKPALWLRAISKHRASISPAPNFAYGLATKRIKDSDLEGVDLSTWQYALNGAEPIAMATVDAFCTRFARFGLRREALMPVYGMSECALAVTFTPKDRGPLAINVDPNALASGHFVAGHRPLVSVGVPVPGFSVKTVDPEGNEVADGNVGRIQVRGPSLMVSYFAQPEETAKVKNGDWLDTGDLGFVYEGELFVSGRAKDLVIIRGRNHAPQGFEDALANVPGVRTGCAVALGFLPKGSDGEALLIVAERAQGFSREHDVQTTTEIRATITRETGITPHTVQLCPAGTLPRTSSGKLRRGEALTRYLAGALTPPQKVNVATLTLALLRSSLAYLRHSWLGVSLGEREL